MGKVKICSTTPLQDQITESRTRLYQIALVWCNDEILANDLVRETIIAGMKNHRQLGDENNLFSWICCIMKNNLCRHLPRQKKHGSIENQSPSCDNETQGNSRRTDIIPQVRQAVAELTLDERQIISLVDLGSLTYCEIAQSLDIPAGAVIGRIHSARMHLLEKLKINQEQKAPVRHIHMVET